jgi:tetratricopeptide (TPR) repeat protein
MTPRPRLFRLLLALSLGSPAARAAELTPSAAAAPAATALANTEAQGLQVIAASLQARSDPVTAVATYRKVLELPGATPAEESAALLGLARTYRHAGTWAKATAMYEKFVRQFPNDERVPDALLEMGRLLRQMGATKLAMNRFYSVIHSAIKVPAEGFDHYQSLARTAEYEIAETYFEAGDYARAGKYFSRLALVDLARQDRAKTSFMSARCQLLGDDPVGGVKALTSFLENWPADENAPEARYLLAVTLRKLGRNQEALDVTLELLRVEKDKASANGRTWIFWQRRTGNMLANEFYEDGDTLSALAIYRGLSDLSDEPTWRLPVLYQIGLCCERLHNYEEARTRYQTIVAAPAATKPDPAPEIAEIVRMASWRMGYLDWLERTDAKLGELLPHNAATPVKPPAATAPAPKPAL